MKLAFLVTCVVLAALILGVASVSAITGGQPDGDAHPNVGAIEEWKMLNLTEDAHPIHIHLVQFEVVGRQAIGGGPSIVPGGKEAWETGHKDTVIAYPGEITTVKAKFDVPGFFVWHCHIVEHEDNEMMRPYHVGPIPPDAPAQ